MEARGDLEEEEEVMYQLQLLQGRNGLGPGTEGPGLFEKWKDETSPSGKNKANKDPHLMGLS